MIRQIIFHWGAAVWYITDDYVKMSSALINFIIDNKKQTLIFYSDKSHKFLRMPLKNARLRVRNYNKDSRFIWGPLKKVGEDKLFGEKVNLMVRFGKRRSDDPMVKTAEFRDELWVLSKLKFLPDAEEALDELLRGSFSSGFPLRNVRYGYIKGREARSMQRSVMNDVNYLVRKPIALRIFAVPVGYKEASSEMELMSVSGDMGSFSSP